MNTIFSNMVNLKNRLILNLELYLLWSEKCIVCLCYMV